MQADVLSLSFSFELCVSKYYDTKDQNTLVIQTAMLIPAYCHNAWIVLYMHYACPSTEPASIAHDEYIFGLHIRSE